MSTLPAQRHLTAKETNVLKLLQYAEGLAETQPRRLGGTLTMPDEAVAGMRKMKVARPYRIERDAISEQNRCQFTLDQLFRYVEFCCGQAGLTIHSDGSITTHDGRTLTLAEVQ